MSIFDDNNEDVKNAIRFFNNLRDDDKVRIVSDLNPNTFKLKKYAKELFPLLTKIQRDISKHDEIKIGTKLMEYGLEETYARLFVTNMKKQAPTAAYQIDQINKIPDDTFCEKLPDIMKYLWVDRNSIDMKMESEVGISIEKLQCIESLTFSLFNGLSRGDITKDIAEESIKVLSKKKLDVLMNQIKIHTTHWRETMIFSDVQDTYFQTNKIIQQNKTLIKLIQELIKLKKDEQFRQRQ